MAEQRHPKRRNPNAERLIFVCELERCPKCDERLSLEGSAAHSDKTVQTLNGALYVVAYSRVCQNPACSEYDKHFHAGERLKMRVKGQGILRPLMNWLEG